MKAAISDRQLTGRILRTAVNNFVERPWGGTSLREYKGLCSLPQQVEFTGSGIGESFEIAAFDADAEAALYPSQVEVAAGDWRALPPLIREHADVLLGQEWVDRYGDAIPLLPKFLNVRELLSVQGHPPGHTEAYIVVSAEPGATIRLGYRRDIDARHMAEELAAGRAAQLELMALLGDGTNWFAVQRLLSAWFARHSGNAHSVAEELVQLSTNPASKPDTGRIRSLLGSLEQTYWVALDAMNEVELEPGQVIHNCNPQRIFDAGGHTPAAEVHALGNPEGREFVMLEVRRPGPTLRTWDNVRFPMRDVDTEAALKVLNLSATRPEEFICSRQALDAPGHWLSVDSPYFRIEHLDLDAASAFTHSGRKAHCLHVLAGAATFECAGGAVAVSAGGSAFVPYALDAYQCVAGTAGAQVVRVLLP